MIFLGLLRVTNLMLILILLEIFSRIMVIVLSLVWKKIDLMELRYTMVYLRNKFLTMRPLTTCEFIYYFF